MIVNFNGRPLLKPCLTATLVQAAPRPAEIILVDNASEDGSADYVQDAFPAVRCVRNRRNEGFAEGCNTGVRAARGEMIVLLNNDAVPDPGWLDGLLAALAPTDVAIAASVIHEDRYPGAYALGTGSISVIGHPIPGVAEDPARPFYATGCSLAFKRDVFPEPFDPLYFAYYEDTLLSWLAHLKGYRVVRALDSTVEHLGGATARKNQTAATFYWERNKLLTLLLCYETSTIRRLVPLYLFDGAARLAEDLWRLFKAPRARGPLARAAARHYCLALKAIFWLLAHRSEVVRRRRAIQSGRTCTDKAVTPMLSGRIFDDHLPTRGHTAANRLALLYCRLAGIRTAEQDPPPT